MPRRRPSRSRVMRLENPVPVALGGRTDDGPDGRRYHVRPVIGGRAVKTYRCPGCDHEIRPGVPHVVAWPAEAEAMGRDGAGAGVVALDDRRHWHTQCWANRATRRPTGKRS